MPSDDGHPESDGGQPEPKVKAVFLIDGTGPRKASPKAWSPGKPPGGKLPPETNPQAKATDNPK